MLKIFAKGFNFSQDGPGNRLVYHLSQCNMRCPWCANPECFDVKNSKAYETEALLKEAVSARAMFFEGGGVTLTGGEPSLQLQGSLGLLRELKKEGIHTAIESNASTDGYLSLLPHTDYIITDIKHTDAEKHLKATGVSSGRVMSNITEALKSGYSLHLRIPLIHGFNDDSAAQAGFVSFFSSLLTLKGSFDLELLCYHEYGKDKWKKLGYEYKITDGFVSAEARSALEASLSDIGVKIIKT